MQGGGCCCFFPLSILFKIFLVMSLIYSLFFVLCLQTGNSLVNLHMPSFWSFCFNAGY